MTVGPPETPFVWVEQQLRELDLVFSRFRADSELSRFNASAGDWLEVSGRMHGLLEHALGVAIASRGLVNVSVLDALLDAGYVRSWFFGAPEQSEQMQRYPARVLPLTSVLELQERRARLAPGHSLDFGAIAKGLWADEFAAALGVNAACNLGGDLKCRGEGPDGAGWPVRLSDGEVILVRNAAVATSGTGKRRWGRDQHHLIDPRTGRPARSDVSHATVIASNATTADWIASAAVVGGSSAVEFFANRATLLEIRTEPVDQARGAEQGVPHELD